MPLLCLAAVAVTACGQSSDDVPSAPAVAPPAETAAQKAMRQTTRVRMRDLMFRMGDRINAGDDLPRLLQQLIDPTRPNGLREIPLDGWGRSFVYERQPDGGTLFGSYGADGRPGGEGFDGDVIGPVPVDIGVRTQRAASERTQIQIDYLISGINLFQIKEDALPESLGELFDERQYMTGRKIPRDAWGNAFLYRKLSAQEYEITSFGADRREGGEGMSADLIGGARIGGVPSHK